MKKENMEIDISQIYTEYVLEDELKLSFDRDLEKIYTETFEKAFEGGLERVSREKLEKVFKGDLENASKEEMEKYFEEDLDLRKTREYMQKSFQDFRIVKELGRGSRGKNKIYLIKKKDSFLGEEVDSSDIEEYALKKISIIRKKKNKKDCTKIELENYEKKRQKRVERVFKSEQRSMTSLRKSQYIVRALGCELWDYEYDDEFGVCMFIQMKVYETLKEQMKKGEEFSEEEIKGIMRDIGGALEDCEENQIIHCDIKPSNIFYDKYEDRYLLGDFGASVHRDDADIVGYTILYAAPEQLRRERVDFYTDVYSFGLTLYQVANHNFHPFIKYKRETCEENIQMRLEHDEDLELPGGDLSEDIAELIIRACAYDVNERYQSISELLDELNEMEFSIDMVSIDTASTDTASTDMDIISMDEGEDSYPVRADRSDMEREGDFFWYHFDERMEEEEDYIQGADYTGKCGENVFFAFRKATGHLHIYGEGEILSVNYENVQGDWGSKLERRFNEKREGLEEGISIISEFEDFIEDIVKITIHEKVTKIDEMAFVEFPRLRYVSIGPDIRRIPRKCFMSCRKLKTVLLPEDLLEIDDMAFWGCGALEKINFPQNMYRIGVAAFKKCRRLRRLSITKIEEIDWFAFQESGLEKVHLWDIRKIGREAFAKTGCLKKVYIGAYWMMEKACFGNSAMEILEIGNEEGGFGYKIEDDILVGCKNLEKISVNMEAVCKTKAFEMYREILTVHETSALRKISAGVWMKMVEGRSKQRRYHGGEMEGKRGNCEK